MSHLKAILSCLGISTDSPVISMADVKSFCPKEFLGDDYMKSNIKYAEICQWLSFSESFNGAEDLSFLNTVFWSQSFLVGNRATLADIALYVTLHTAGGFTSFSSICRWFDHIQSLFGVSSGLSLVLIPKHPTLFPCKTIGQSTSPAQASTTAVTAATAVKAPEKVSATANVSSVALNPSTEIKVPKDPNTSKEKPVKPAASKETLPPLADGDDLNPTLLDIRVGKVVKCWDHPESEKLLCEEIDLGEGSHRMIASGLRAFYKSSDLEGRNVMVLSNLKERPMAGFKSQGMVLCACNADHSEVKLLDPPASASIGDRVTFPGYSGEPAQPNQVAKKKILEKLAPMLKTDSNGLCLWNTSPFTLGSDVCTAPMPDAVIS